MRLLRTVSELRNHLDARRQSGAVVGAVPTMGALHEGHLSLLRAARARTDEVVVTIFVNPTQFGPNEDFERYPRDLETDRKLCESAGADVVFAPDTQEMYPAGERTRVRVEGELTECLCGASRPGHFEGVTTIVNKLFNAVGPGVYFFGQKDFQQLAVIRRMAKDLLLPVEIIGCPIVREADGLAMSSRNRYLSDEQRERALAISRGLTSAILAYTKGERDPHALRQVVEARLVEAGLIAEYVDLRDAENLSAAPPRLEGPTLLAVAAFVGGTRLIDNVVLGQDEGDLVQGGES